MPPLSHHIAPIRAAMTVHEVMARFPETYHIFHRFRMDGPWEAWCTLEVVAATHGRDLAALLAALNGAVHAARHVPTGSSAVTP